jgi:hypothetical protein
MVSGQTSNARGFRFLAPVGQQGKDFSEHLVLFGEIFLGVPSPLCFNLVDLLSKVFQWKSFHMFVQSRLVIQKREGYLHMYIKHVLFETSIK